MNAENIVGVIVVIAIFIGFALVREYVGRRADQARKERERRNVDPPPRLEN